MNNITLYILTVVIWGSTWITIKYQLGVVSPMVSIAHRFMLGAVLIFLYLVLRRKLVALPLRDHGFLFLQGLSLFCINYVFIYNGAAVLTSGLVAVVFSTIVFFNLVNGVVLMGQRASIAVLVGGLIGVTGMVGVFLPELQALSLTDNIFRGLLMCLAGTFFASIGNVLAVRNRGRALPVLLGNAWGMAYGSLTLYLVALLSGQPIMLDWSLPYLTSLLYLSVFGSVIAFWAYVTLIGNIGADRAGYSSLLFPVVALVISTIFEAYVWTWTAFAGLSLVLLGNWLVMYRSKVSGVKV